MFKLDGIIDPRVRHAMRAVPREAFVPDRYQDFALADHPLPIGHGQTISQPSLVAHMCQMAAIEPEHRLLEIGTGSGYQTAILSQLGQHVVSLEVVKALHQRAAAQLHKQGCQNVTLLLSDGYLGWSAEAPYDAIMVTAAPSHIPPALVEQLAEGGRMVIPVGEQEAVQQLMLLEKTAGAIIEKRVMPVRFVPLTREVR
uniref:Protein-L-isoaspartate O-methyltransferase n=1 Tax=Magnetococcus massalia (strain MO-1) TaxID=451514 RepID=A0A1S7LIS6_MAGMO|nr:Protein-L-isoaspartate O-methyltransferase 2 [Candidatus Magnetococcus massalia]